MHKVVTAAVLVVVMCGEGSADELAMTTVEIAKISIDFGEEEGGAAHQTIYPSGWLEFSGHKSCCGYVPPLADGWYRLDRAVAQTLFDHAAIWIATGVARTEAPQREANQTYTEILLGSGKRYFVASDMTGLMDAPIVNRHTRPVLERPSDVTTVRYRGVHLSDVKVLRVLHGKPEAAATLDRKQVAQLIAALRAEAGTNVSLGQAAMKALGQVPSVSLDLVVGLLDGDRPRILSTADVVSAIAMRGADARPYVARIVATAKDDKSLVAAARAVHLVGGDAAVVALDDKLVPALGDKPKEPKLQTYYRLEFAMVLREIDTPKARAMLARKVYPAVKTLLGPANIFTLADAAKATEVWKGLPEAIELGAIHRRTLVTLLRSKEPGDRWMAAEHAAHLWNGRPPAEIRAVLEPMRKDPESSVRSWVEQALKAN